MKVGQVKQRSANKKSLRKRILRNYELYLFLIPAIVILVVFDYLPMLGVEMAFLNFKPYTGFFGSEWVGLKHFKDFLSMPKFPTILKNTLTLSLYSIIAGFPLPIILALALNAIPFKRYKRVVQTVSYAPHFISTVVLVGMINILFAPSSGIIKNLLESLGLLDGYLKVLMSESAFPHLYVWSGIWSSLGWDSIIYLGALAGIDQSLHEAAIVDGANKLQRIWHVDIPGILPTIVVLFIMRTGSVLGVGFEKTFLMQNSFNINVSEVISTYVYKVGIGQGQYSLSAAIGLFNSVVNFIVLIIVNAISRKVSKNSLF